MKFLLGDSRGRTSEQMQNLTDVVFQPICPDSWAEQGIPAVAELIEVFNSQSRALENEIRDYQFRQIFSFGRQGNRSMGSSPSFTTRLDHLRLKQWVAEVIVALMLDTELKSRAVSTTASIFQC